MNVQPYTYEQARDLVRVALQHSTERHKRWRMLQALYRTGSVDQAEAHVGEAGKLGELYPELTDEVVNLVLPHLNVILASVIARDPKFVAVPYGGGEAAEAHRDTVEGVLTYFWERIGATDELRDATQDAIHLGSGFLKGGWTTVEAEVDRDDGEVYDEALDLAYGEELLADLSGDEEYEADLNEALDAVPRRGLVTLMSQPYLEYVSPFDIFVSVGARRLEDARWIAHRVTLPMDEVLANPAYDATEEDLRPDSQGHVSPSEEQAEWTREALSGELASNEVATKTVTLFEFYDMRTRRLQVFQLDAEKPLYDDEFAWSHIRPPFVHIRNYRKDGNDLWGFGDLENIATPQHLFNEFLAEQIGSARRAGNKYGVRADLFTDDLKAALEAADGDITVPVDMAPGEDLRNVVVPFERKPMPEEQYAAKLEMKDAVREVLGINDFQAGGVGADRMSATAAAVVDGVATLRAQDKIASVERAAAHAATLILLLAQEFLDTDTAVRVAGVERAEWRRVSPDDIAGEFQVRIEGGSTRALNPQTREAQGMRTITEVLPMLTQLGYDPAPALRSGLRDLGYDPDVLLGDGPMPAPAEEGGAPPEQGGQPPAAGGAPSADPFVQQVMAQLGLEGEDLSAAELMELMGGPPTASAAQEAGGVLL